MAEAVRRRHVGKLRRFEVVQLWIARSILWFMVAVMFIPLLSVLTASLQVGDSFFSPSLFPNPKLFTWNNYVRLFTTTQFPGWMKNTVYMGILTGLVQVVMTTLAAYAFSRLKFWGQKKGIQALLLLQMMPSFVSLAAIQFVLFRLGLANKVGLLLVYTGTSAYNIWLVKGYMDGLPRELDEAAKVDGCTDWMIFTRIILPLARPIMAVMFLFAFVGVFSEFIMASALLRNAGDMMLAQGLRTFTQNQFSTNWGRFSAAVVLSAFPLAVIWMFAQRFVESGLTRGSVKG